MFKANKFMLSTISFIFLFSFGFLSYKFCLNSIIFMPKEYKTIKKLVDQIALKNYLGDQDIPFSIASGSYMEYEAEKLGISNKDNSYYLKNLNAYKKHPDLQNINLNELSKQAYLYNSIEAYAWNQIVWLSKSSFRTVGNKTNYLAWYIAHELSHVVHNDHIEQSIKLSKKLKELEKKIKGKNNELNNSVINKKLKIEKDEKIDLFKKLLSRETEKFADKEGAKMIINAGFPKDTPLEALIFLTKTSYLDAHTDSKSTHPGHSERYSSLKKFIENYDGEKELRELKNYSWKWIYNRSLNTLTFIPKKL